MDVVIIQIVIGLVLAFSLLSVVVSQAIELVRISINGRSRFLYEQMKSWFYANPQRGMNFPFLNDLLQHPLLDVVKTSDSDASVGLTRNDDVDKNHLTNIIVQAILDNQTLPQHLQKVLDGLGIDKTELITNNVITSYLLKGEDIPAELDKQLRDLGVDPALLADQVGAKLGVNIKELTTKVLEIKTQIDTLRADVQSELQKTESLIEAWIDKQFNSMSKVFKRQQYMISLMVALIIAMILNIDSIQMSIILWKDPSLRTALVQVANNVSTEQSAKDSTSSNSGADLTNISGTDNVSGTQTNIDSQISQTKLALDELLGSSLPIGWTCGPWDATCEQKNTSYFEKGQDLRSWHDIGTDWRLIVIKLLGWIITAVAVSLGQDFWFNLLRKLTQRDSSD